MAIDPAGLNSQIANRQSENADMIPRIAQLTAEGQLDRAAQYQARLDVNNEFIAKAETALAADGGPPAAPTPTTSNPPDPQVSDGTDPAVPASQIDTAPASTNFGTSTQTFDDGST